MQCDCGSVKLDRPIYVGKTVLDLSKTLMYRFHYDHLVCKYRQGMMNLLFTGTGSLCYEIFTSDIYDNMKVDALSKYDFSNYDELNPLYSDANRKLIVYMKDELVGKPMREFAGARSICCSLLFHDHMGTDHNICANEYEQPSDVPEGKIRMQKSSTKSVKKQVKNKHLRHRFYVDCVKNLSTVKVNQNSIVSKDHVIMSVQRKKIALAATDDKRWIQSKGINTFAFGHYKTL